MSVGGRVEVQIRPERAEPRAEPREEVRERRARDEAVEVVEGFGELGDGREVCVEDVDMAAT